MECRECKEIKEIKNKHFKLCLKCNNIRLYGNPYGKVYKDINNNKNNKIPSKNKINQKKSLFTSNTNIHQSKKRTIDRDEEFYEKCFNNSNHRCEECNKELPDSFRDSEGKIIARYRYSHIIPKSIEPSLRWILKNINHLCLECHGMWENGDKKNMRIYKKNQKRFPYFFTK